MSDLIKILFLVSALLLMKFVQHRYNLSLQIREIYNRVTEDRRWMENYFGTYRDYEYEPLFPRDESRQMIDFLEKVEHESARALQQIAEDYLDSGSIPQEVDGDAKHYRTVLICEVCHALQRRQKA